MTEIDDISGSIPQPGPIALVLGATGGIGGAVARALTGRGYHVRALHRDAARMVAKQKQGQPVLEWVQGDAMNRADVLKAAKGASVILHGVNPPGYRNWGKLVLPMIDNTIAAARASGACILMPGTIYNYGPDAFPLLNEVSPQHPQTVKGQIRVELERRLEQAAGEGVRVILVRAGDFFGPDAGNNWFAQGLITPGKPATRVNLPGRPGVSHSWAYLPDVAEIFIRLLECAPDLPAFARFHMQGHVDTNGYAMAQAIRRASGSDSVRFKRFPWWMVPLLSPILPVFKELMEMRYLWREPIALDNRRLVEVLGEEPRTALDVAVATTLKSLKCLQTNAVLPEASRSMASETALD
ncbi:SDR family NAD(P)-dependent oxidoreductase [Agrobacterium vitis]|uniref:SDR family NAD(P)-dependent oxidoreductase n=1 Tax=Agrobacterium vitis TaxID=373 RepID=A0A368NJG2_AGRVI|nr:SDR family NAD(P)-dependent oxidoreductase [Agrobacterium vitis]KAA3511951.1 SDR family NAD(P)-dependent oxidoreductase [Agrobacterium vitis]KAA3525393.1 SDR family NAD(P)-dependent oxidoreductase [Agrobacterium vitis]MCF1479196.1 SDR family NAD(P)-dependent oxidoreductase [Agrobacterium vitis]MUZ97715.1 SDR family NAD(P)-dependent oxidoreductase [Agrobacterium vitis]MVA30306.1 SDR family NAD(P)-dependent oxidoreductase [Agrobacterium vitis]